MQHLTALERRAAVSLALVFAFRMLGLFMLIPVFALYGTHLVGYSPLWVGLAIGAYGLTQAVLQIPMGWLSDRIGRKPVMLIGLTLFVIGSVVAALAESVYAVTAGRVLQGMGAISGAVLALAADVTREDQRPKVMAIIGATIGLSFTAAMVTGPAIAEHFGLSGIFWFTAFLATFGIVLVIAVVPHAPQSHTDGEALAKNGFVRTLMRHPELRRLNLGVLCLHLLLTAIFVALPAKLVQAGQPAATHWQLYLPVLLAAFVLMVPLMMAAMRKQQEKGYFKVAILLLVASLSALAVASYSHQLTYAVAAGALLIFFIGFNYLEASMPALVSRIAPAGQKGTAMGIYASAQFFGAFLGGAIGGAISGQFGLSAVFAMAIGIGLIWLIIAHGMQIPAKAQRLSFAITLPDAAAQAACLRALQALPGVQDATIVDSEQRCYLKVDATGFNIEQAQAILAGRNHS
jgi:MFS family permease